MSQENVEAFRNVIKAINERGADARLDLLDAEVEFREDPTFPEAQVYRGRGAVVRNFREFTSPLSNLRGERYYDARPALYPSGTASLAL